MWLNYLIIKYIRNTYLRKVSAPLDEVGPGSIPFTKLKVLFLSYHFTGEMGLFFKPLTLSESKIHTHTHTHTHTHKEGSSFIGTMKCS